tara:strand:+ start:723 stop:1388 length:666 start_codon:yes stop_codon:yes gene_type:complete
MSDANYVPWAIVRIIFILIVTAILTSMISIRYSTKDFEKMRCYPTVIPFVSILNPEISTLDNFHYCIKKIATPLVKKNTSKALDKPMSQIIAGVSESNERVAEITKASNQLVDRFQNSQNSIKEAFERSRFMGFYVTQKIQNFFSKIISTIVVFYYMMITMINSVIIMIGGILKIANYLIKQGSILIINPSTRILGAVYLIIGGNIKLLNKIAKSKSKSQS